MTRNEILRRWPNASKDVLAKTAEDVPVPVEAGSSTAKPMTTDEIKLNKTEKAFLSWLRLCKGPDTWIGVQCITLKLADDCRYTCDFWIAEANGTMTGYEVKGFMRDDARVKIKVAARMFWWWKFVIVRKEKGNWLFEEVKP